MANREQQLSNLLKWLGTFDLQAPHSTVEDISDGVALSEALTQIAPEWFTAAWRAKIKTDVGANWRLRVSNMKKIVEAVIEYYVECLNEQLSGYAKPDAAKIGGEQCDNEELRRLLQLIVGCAVKCNQKQQYINRIMLMEESVQQALKQIIEELDGPENLQSLRDFESCYVGPGRMNVDAPDGGHSQRLYVELQETADMRDQLAQRCRELDQQLSLLQEERSTLIAENKKLQERVDEFENPEESSSISRYSGLRRQVEGLKEELFKAETTKDDYRMKAELLEKEILELHSRLEDLQKEAEQANRLKDEVDALKEDAYKAAEYKIQVESLKKKLETMSDLKRQLKIMEDSKVEYLQYKIDYEEAMKHTAMLRSHLEACKQQLTEVHHRKEEESNKCDRLEFENKKMEAKLSALQRERDRLITERDALKEMNEELAAENVTATRPNAAGVTGNEIIPFEVKEKLHCLKLENEMLKKKLKMSGNEDVPSVQALLEDSVNTLRGQNRKANQRIIELEAQLEEIMGSRSSDGGNTVMNQKMSQLQEELRKAQTEKERLTVQLEERESALQTQRQKVYTLQEKLSHKEDENAALQERYRKYIDKAKSVIKSLDPKQRADNSSPNEVIMLRNQVQEQRKRIEDMERDVKEDKLVREMEEKLMVSAFYRLGQNCHREVMDQRLAALSSGQGQSFLARQRQPSARRYPPYNSK